MPNLDFGTAFWKKNGTQVRVTVSDFRGVNYLHIREYQMDGDTGNWFPTKQGYAFDADKVSDLIELLSQAERQVALLQLPSKQLEFDFS